MNPKLTKLDQAVLDRVPQVRGRRALVIRSMLKVPAGERRPDEKTVREILRGLESVGRVRSSGGWWSRP